jgi:3-dehydroquinate synthase
VGVGLALDTLYSARAGLLNPSIADQVLRVLEGLQLAIYHPALDWLDTSGRRRVLDGLDEFREHLGGRLTVLLLADVGRGVDVHQLDEGLLGECVDELKARWERGV